MEIPTWSVLTAQLLSLAETRLLDPLEILLESELESVRSRLAERAGAWAAHMLGADAELATRTAIRLVSVLYPGDGPFDPPAEWWRTPLGIVVAWRAGHPGADAISYAVAGAMLGVSKQAVHDLVNRGKLDRHADGGVTTASVHDRISQRATGGVRAQRRGAESESRN
ncbi:hypothetical protein [Amycolatopsis sp. MtRt-6]|uniref:hypothetical protein n=1 Tax=Amycolatopsis sp. MtRt-6 TaxID=2792782 RepID=UPI001A8FD56F|nr:hypothetical protein [Amycolatopsis sp. MtRt-6]